MKMSQWNTCTAESFLINLYLYGFLQGNNSNEMLPNEHLLFGILKLNRAEGQKRKKSRCKKVQKGILQKLAILMKHLLMWVNIRFIDVVRSPY